jgi:G3E family GTPase
MTSLWKATAAASPGADASVTTRSPLAGLPREPVDVVVVGAGITGLSTALMLLRAGRSVIVVEASGVADPAPVVAIGELDSSLAIHGVVVVADDDTMQAASDRYVGDTITRQLQAADLIVLNKSDLATPQQRHETLAWLDERWPQARVVETAHGAITPDLVLDLDPPGRARGAVQSIARSDPFVSLSFRTRELVQREAFGAVLDALPRSVLRAKGVLFFADAPTRPHLLHIVGRRSTLEPFDGTAVRRETRLVFIGIAGEFDTETLRGELEAALAPPAGVD